MNNKKIGLVLGAGRSGTSVLTNILIAQGMIGSDDMIEASEANPKGGFEDKEIFQLQREVFNVLGLSGYAPLPNNFLKGLKYITDESHMLNLNAFCISANLNVLL